MLLRRIEKRYEELGSIDYQDYTASFQEYFMAMAEEERYKKEVEAESQECVYCGKHPEICEHDQPDLDKLIEASDKEAAQKKKEKEEKEKKSGKRVKFADKDKQEEKEREERIKAEKNKLALILKEIELKREREKQEAILRGEDPDETKGAKKGGKTKAAGGKKKGGSGSASPTPSDTDDSSDVPKLSRFKAAEPIKERRRRKKATRSQSCGSCFC